MAERRGGRQTAPGKAGRGQTHGEVRERQAMEAERRAPLHGDRSCQVVDRTARGAEQEDLSPGLEGAEKAFGFSQPHGGRG